MRALDRDGETWVADVHCDQMVYLEDPDPIVPERPNFKGMAPSRLVAQTKGNFSISPGNNRIVGRVSIPDILAQRLSGLESRPTH